MSAVQNTSSTTPAGPPKSPSSLVRYALLAMVVLSLSFSAVFGTIGIIVLKKIGGQMTELQQIAIWFHIFVYMLFAIFCFLGVYACIVKRRGVTSLFTSLVIGQILFSVGSGALCLYLLFNNTRAQPWDADKCLAVAFDKFTQQLCHKTKLLKGFAIAMFIVMWLVEIVTIFVGNAFLSQLHDEAIRSGKVVPKYDLDGEDC
ncbi:hypothetical protein FPV67DRAFT_1670114 [Lyophyllum atratum]|nr:hypothetical protein FPV67DRAFT_1670114 [Lyophyllum atratum]